MNIETLTELLFWSAVMNMGLLLGWILLFIFARDWVYKYHSKWFQLSPERFDTLHYSGMMLLKLSIFVFNIVPYLALKII